MQEVNMWCQNQIVMYEFRYDYIKPKYRENVKLCYMVTDNILQGVSQYIGPLQTYIHLEQKATETKTQQLWKLENITILKTNNSLHQFSLYLQHITKCAPNVHLSTGDDMQSCQSF